MLKYQKDITNYHNTHKKKLLAYVSGASDIFAPIEGKVLKDCLSNVCNLDSLDYSRYSKGSLWLGSDILPL